MLVNLGGDIAVAGSSPPRGWPVLVTDDSSTPPARAATVDGQTVSIRAGGLATSGIAARRWRHGGDLLHHLIDPRSGFPTAGPWRTVSVTAGSCLLANIAATAAMILGDAAPRWLTDRGLPARLIGHDGSVTLVGGWPR